MRFFAFWMRGFDGGIPGLVISRSEKFASNSDEGRTKEPFIPP